VKIYDLGKNLAVPKPKVKGNTKNRKKILSMD